MQTGFSCYMKTSEDIRALTDILYFYRTFFPIFVPKYEGMKANEGKKVTRPDCSLTRGCLFCNH